MITVSVPATDGESGVTQVALSADGASWTVRPYAPTQPWTLDGGDGLKVVHARWRDGSGNWSAPTSASIMLDRTSPAVGALLRPTLRLDAALTGGRAPVLVRWSATDSGSGVARHDVALRTDGGPWVVVAGGIPTNRLEHGLAPGHTYAWRVRVVDRAGNVSGWTTGSTVRVSGYGETNAAVRYLGTWRTVRGTSYWGSSARRATLATARASITVSARQVGLVLRKGAGMGRVAIEVDGVRVATIDLYSATSRYRVVVWTRAWSASGTHTIRIRPLGTVGRPAVDLDGIVTIN